MEQSPNLDLTTVDKDITVKEFTDLLKQNNIGYYSSVSYINGNSSVYPFLDTFDNQKVDHLCFLFRSEKLDAKLIKVRFDMRNESGVSREYIYKPLTKPWWKGGEII